MKKTLLLISSTSKLAQAAAHFFSEYTVLTASSSCKKADIRIDNAGNITPPPTPIDAAIFFTGYSSISACEKNPARAAFVNEMLPLTILEQLLFHSPVFPLFLSTDAVFYSENTEPLRESTPPNPRSVYGKTKAAAENGFLSHGGAVVRLPRVWHGEANCFTIAIQDELKKKYPTFVDDQFFRPIHLSDVLSVLRMLLLKKERGIFHLPGPELHSWFSLAERLSRDETSRSSFASCSLRSRDNENVRSPFLNLIDSRGVTGDIFSLKKI